MNYEQERLRGANHLYLRSLRPCEELASFLVQRAFAFEAHEMYGEAMSAFAAAVKLAPHNDEHVMLSKQCNQKQLNKILAPWGINASQFCDVVQRRFTGAKVLYPWDLSSGRPNPEANPFLNPLDAAVLNATIQVVLGRLHGVNQVPVAWQSYVKLPRVVGSLAIPAANTPQSNSRAVDDVFAGDLLGLFKNF